MGQQYEIVEQFAKVLVRSYQTKNYLETTMKKKRKPITAQEIVDRLESDPEWVARQQARNAKIDALGDAFKASEAPLVADLRKAGFDVESAWDLFNRKEPWRKDLPISAYPEAIPILLEHFKQSYPAGVREGIVRALTDKLGYGAFDKLIEEYKRTADPRVTSDEQRDDVELVMATQAKEFHTREELESIMWHRWLSYRFVLANAITFHFKQEHIPLLIELIQDATNEHELYWRGLSKDIRKKMNRWGLSKSELLTLLDSIGEPVDD